MNLPNKITLSRIIMTFVVIFILIFPFDSAGLVMPKLFIDEKIVVDIRYLIAGVLFIIASLTDLVDGKLARKYNMVTDLGKMMDSIADKILVNPILVILAATGFISPIIPIIIIIRDEIVNNLKMIVGNKGQAVGAITTGKFKTAFMMTGIVLTLFYNLPFELWNIRVSDALLIIACVLSIVSGVQYYQMSKKYLFETEK